MVRSHPYPPMPERQTELPLDTGFNLAPAVQPELREEIARAWGLPIGQRVAVAFRNNRLDAAAGRLELAAAPDFPWNPHHALQLRIAGCNFSSRDIERWHLL